MSFATGLACRDDFLNLRADAEVKWGFKVLHTCVTAGRVYYSPQENHFWCSGTSGYYRTVFCGLKVGVAELLRGNPAWLAKEFRLEVDVDDPPPVKLVLRSVGDGTLATFSEPMLSPDLVAYYRKVYNYRRTHKK